MLLLSARRPRPARRGNRFRPIVDELQGRVVPSALLVGGDTLDDGTTTTETTTTETTTTETTTTETTATDSDMEHAFDVFDEACKTTAADI